MGCLGQSFLLAPLELLECFGPQGAGLCRRVLALPAAWYVGEVAEGDTGRARGALMEGAREGAGAPKRAGERRWATLLWGVPCKHIEALDQGRAHHPKSPSSLAPNAEGWLRAALHRGRQHLSPCIMSSHRAPMTFPWEVTEATGGTGADERGARGGVSHWGAV